MVENKLLKYLPKKKQWFVLLLVGILLIIMALPTNSSSESDINTTKQTTYEYTMYEDASDDERHLEHMLNHVKNVGTVHVMITYRNNDEVCGIVVVAEGADDEEVVRNITEVTQALFDVDSHKIKVIKSK